MSLHFDRYLFDLAERMFLTVLQAAALWSVSERSARRVFEDLEARGLVEASKEIRPFVWRLSHKGAALTGKSFQRRWVSANAIHQYLLRNEVELKAAKSDGFKFLDRSDLWRMGFFPAIGEHIVQSGTDDRKYSLVLIDDYGMPTRKLAMRLVRGHNPTAKYYQGVQREWLALVNSIVIFTTTKERVFSHKKAVQYEIQNFDRLAEKTPVDGQEMQDRKIKMRGKKADILKLLETTKVASIKPILKV